MTQNKRVGLFTSAVAFTYTLTPSQAPAANGMGGSPASADQRSVGPRDEKGAAQRVIDQAQLDSGINAAKSYTDTKVAGLVGRLDVADIRLKGIDDKLVQWASVPTDLATLKERVSHLPTKEELGTKLRNYLTVAGIAISCAGTVIGTVFHFLAK